MIINKALTMFRCKLNMIHVRTSSCDLDTQSNILNSTLNPSNTYFHIKQQLDLAMQKDENYRGFTDEVQLLLNREGDEFKPPRGHDYLKLWFKAYFMINFQANFIIADAATHHVLQNVLSHEQKAELLRMIRGFKRDLIYM